jgi:CheY-like chemotaxis protein
MNKRILIIEDDPSLREIYAMALELDGFIVTTAPNGKEALSLLTTPGGVVPDCIVTDLRMPVMNGETFIEILRTTYPEKFSRVPIIVCTAYGAEVNNKWIYARIIKPIPLDLLVSTVEKALSSVTSSIALLPLEQTP